MDGKAGTASRRFGTDKTDADPARGADRGPGSGSCLSGPGQKCLLGSAEHTGLSEASAAPILLW